MMVIVRTGRKKQRWEEILMMMLITITMTMMTNTVPLNARDHANYLTHNVI